MQFARHLTPRGRVCSLASSSPSIAGCFQCCLVAMEKVSCANRCFLDSPGLGLLEATWKGPVLEFPSPFSCPVPPAPRSGVHHPLPELCHCTRGHQKETRRWKVRLEMARQLRARAVLTEALRSVLGLHVRAHNCPAPVPGDPVPSAGIVRHQAHLQYGHTCRQSLIQIK